MKDLISFNRETGLGPIASLRAYAAQHESARPGALQGLRQTSAEGGEHSPPFREEARPTQSQSFSAGVRKRCYCFWGGWKRSCFLEGAACGRVLELGFSISKPVVSFKVELLSKRKTASFILLGVRGRLTKMVEGQESSFQEELFSN